MTDEQLRPLLPLGEDDCTPIHRGPMIPLSAREAHAYSCEQCGQVFEYFQMAEWMKARGDRHG